MQTPGGWDCAVFIFIARKHSRLIYVSLTEDNDSGLATGEVEAQVQKNIDITIHLYFLPSGTWLVYCATHAGGLICTDACIAFNASLFKLSNGLLAARSCLQNLYIFCMCWCMVPVLKGMDSDRLL